MSMLNYTGIVENAALCIGEKKHCQIDDLQEKYVKEISANQLTESQKQYVKEISAHQLTESQREYVKEISAHQLKRVREKPIN